MTDTSQPRFWTGPIHRADQATRIVTITGLAFAVVDSLALLGSIAGGDLTKAITAGCLTLPALSLLVWPTRFAALLLLIESALATLSLGLGAIGAILTGDTATAPYFLIMLGLWTLPCLLTLRAWKASRYLASPPS